MKKLYRLISLCLLLGVARPASATLNYIYPLGIWNVTTQHGEELSSNYYHMGVDAGGGLEAGEPVYASADGVVREAQERSQFGLVVLIEHTADSGATFISLYGHLSPSDTRVTPGQTVEVGDTIGVLGSTSENGGWPVHLHYGIHKSPYSAVWIYYGHVHDAAAAADWYDPEKYIPKHLHTDDWSPSIAWEYEDGQVIGEDLDIDSTVRDIGSGVQSVEYKARVDTTDSWTVLSGSDASLEQFEDGTVYLRAVVKDNFDNKTVKTVRLLKDPERFTATAFVAIKGGGSSGMVTRWSFAGTELKEFSPFSSTWAHGGDIATGDVTGDGELDVVVAQGSAHRAGRIRIYTQEGIQLTTWKAFSRGAIRLTTGDLTGDDKAEIIVGSSKRQPATVRVFTRNGTLLWEVQPFSDLPRTGLDVATGDIDGDGKNEVIVGTGSGTKTRVTVISNDGSTIINTFMPIKKFTGGVNIASGDIDGDDIAEIIVGTQGSMSGTVKMFTGEGEFTGQTFIPFGDAFTGSVDVALTQWDDNTGALELITSQASNGQAWTKLFRLTTPEEILLESRIFEAEFEGGARVAGWIEV